MLQGVVRTHGVVVILPRGDDVSGIVQIREPVLVQAFGADLVVNALDVRVLGGLHGAAEGECHLTCVRPRIEGAHDRLGAAVIRDRVGHASQAGDIVEYAHDPCGGQRRVEGEGETFPRAGVDQTELAKAATGRTLVADEAHGPDPIGLRGNGRRHPGERDLLPASAV